MQQRSTLEEDIHRIMASLDEEGDNEETAPLEEAEPLETYHVYPVPGGIVILKEEQPEDNVIVETTLAQTKMPPIFMAYATCVFYLFLVLSCIAFQVYGLLNPPIATVIITPKSQIVTLTGTLQLGRILSPLTLSQSQTAPTTGKGHQSAKSATGLITFYNGQFQRVTIAAGTILTGADGIQVITDQDASIPAANPPIFGQVTISAHAINPGVKGNIPAYDINQACCATSVLAKNIQPFTGGQDERDFSTVSQQDINKLSTSLKTSLTQSVAGAFYSQLKPNEQVFILPCHITVISDHQPGQEATLVKVTVSQTCSAVAYNSQELETKATDFLTHHSATKLETGYSLLGAVKVSVTQATIHKQVIVSFSASGTWIYALSRAAQQQIKSLIAGKTKQQVLQLLASLSGVEHAAIRFDGFGDDTRVPKDPATIHLVLIFSA